MAEFNLVLSFTNVLLLAVLVARLVWNGLHLRYRAFFFWVCFQAFRTAALVILIRDRGFSLHLWFRPEPFSAVEAYFYFWFWTEPILIVAFVVAVFEIYSLSLQRYRGIRTISRKILTLSLVLASVISVLSILPDLQFNADPENTWFLLTNVIRRGIYTSLLAFLVLLVSFITIFPVQLSRNSILHVGLFTTVFLSNSLTILTMNFWGPDVIPLINAVTNSVLALAYLSWILFFTPAGETVERTVRSGVSEPEAELLLMKLRQINDSLTESHKRL